MVNSYDGTGRGNYILTFVLFVVLWTFSIPVEFRRAHICQTQRCIDNRAACYDCVTPEEWKAGIVEYYKGGGGVQFDFSIDPATKAKFMESLGRE